ncbi:MAG: ATP-binding cassette domain-containing protein [Alphaproteobacteria bacterium]|nr:ATP-binding cassette domain-containing protein [Alphaproteobacteria bacterium]
MSTTPLLEARGLTKEFPLGGGLLAKSKSLVRAVSDVSFRLEAGTTLALVGESGCGKTTLARMAALLTPASGGSVLYRGEEVTGGSRSALKSFRRHMGLVFQDPYASLNPRMTAARTIAEPMLIHGAGNRLERRYRVQSLLEHVGLGPRDGERYPHTFSGGQRQRIALARALALEPELVIADEPLSALDVSIQSQMLNLMRDLQDEMGLAFLFISHDLAVVESFAHHVAVLYLGRIVESADTTTLFRTPAHPYTRALMKAVPRIGEGRRHGGATAAPGEPPSPVAPPPGCAFHPRCPKAQALCRDQRPQLENIGDGGNDDAHICACHFPETGSVRP